MRDKFFLPKTSLLRWPLIFLLVLVIVVIAPPPQHTAQAQACTFSNPVRYPGQDPSVVYRDGNYYLVQSVNDTVVVRRSTTLAGLRTAANVVVWDPTNPAYDKEVWAPELQYIDGNWYIYVAASNGTNATHRMYALSANSQDPQGSWTFRGQLATEKWAIDGMTFKWNNQLYHVWSGWPGDTGDFPQNLYIAPMSNPWTISGARAFLAGPYYAWEQSVAALLEGPEAVIYNGSLYVVFSADASWTTAYKLGVMRFTGTNIYNYTHWTKRSTPVFQGTSSVYGPGHHNLFMSPNGAEHWIIYHAKVNTGNNWDREMKAQRFTWSADGWPNFGAPVNNGVVLGVPAGESCSVVPTNTPVPAIRRLLSSNIANNYVRHMNGRFRIDPNVTPIQDSQFRIVAGLADPSAISFQSVNFPGSYLRHRNGEVWLDTNDGSALFKADATFRRRPGLANSALTSYEAYNFAGSYLRHRNSLLYLTTIATALDRSDATFQEVN